MSGPKYVRPGKARRFADQLDELFPAYQAKWIRSQTYGGRSALEIVRMAVAEEIRRRGVQPPRRGRPSIRDGEDQAPPA